MTKILFNKQSLEKRLKFTNQHFALKYGIFEVLCNILVINKL